MMTRRRTWGGITLGSAAAAGMLLLTAHGAGAGTSVTITSGGCSGGGSHFCYNPESVSGTTGVTITWNDQSAADHTATLCTAAACPGAPASSGSCAPFNVTVKSGGSGSQSFTSPGTCYYYCSVHGYAFMHGVVVIAAAPTPTPNPTPPPTSQATPPLGTPRSTPGPGSPAAATPTTAVAATPGVAAAPPPSQGTPTGDVQGITSATPATGPVSVIATGPGGSSSLGVVLLLVLSAAAGGGIGYMWLLRGLRRA